MFEGTSPTPPSRAITGISVKASGYAVVLRPIKSDVETLMLLHPAIFDFLQRSSRVCSVLETSGWQVLLRPHRAALLTELPRARRTPAATADLRREGWE